MSKQWYENPLRICAFQWSLGEHTFEAPRLVNDGGFNVEQVCHVLEDQSLAEIYDQVKHESRLKRYIAESKLYGTRLIIYFNAHCVFPDVIRDNPDWAQLRPDGQPANAYGTYLFTCVNSPWRDHFRQSVQDCLQLDVDGIFLDGPIFAETTCTCAACRHLFQTEYGHALEEGTAREISAFRTDSISRFVRDVKTSMLAVRPDAILYANNTGLAQNVTGCTIDGLWPYVDFIGTEGGFIFYDDPNRTSLWKGLQNANYLESKSRGKPYVIFTAGNHCSWARSMHSPEETVLLFASAVSQGASVWYGVHGPAPMLETRGGQAGLNFNRFLARNEGLLTQTRRRAEVALLWSSLTLANFPEDVEQSDFTQQKTVRANYDHGRFTQEFKAFANILIRSHVQLAIIDEGNLTDAELAGYKMLVLPNAACLDQTSVNRIARYVRSGGTILATMATSFFDENGCPLERPALADVLGIESVGAVHHYGDGCGYLSIEDADLRQQGELAALTGGFSTALQCSYSERSVPLAAMYLPMQGSYDPFPTEKFTAITRTSCGGGQSIYIAGDAGATLTNHGLVELRHLVGSLIRSAYSSCMTVMNAYESLAVSLREQPAESRWLIHLVNYTGQMQRPIDQVISCRNVRIELRTDVPVRFVEERLNGTTLPFERDGDSIRFSVPEINLYQLIVVQFEQ